MSVASSCSQWSKLPIYLSAVIGVAVLTGCATVLPKEAGFSDVQQQVSQRVGSRVQWNQDAAASAEVDTAVAKLLQDDLTADEAVQIALLNNRNLQATYEGLGLAQAGLVQAGLLANPVFNAGVFFPAGGGQVDLDFGITQSFLSILYRPLRQKIAASQFEAAKLSVTGAVVDLAAEVREAFYRVQADQQLGELLAQVIETTEASAYLAQRLRAAGNITQLEHDREQVFYESSRQTLAEGEAKLALDRERLNVLLGLWGTGTQWSIAPRLPAVAGQLADAASLEQQAIGTSLNLGVLRRQIESAATRLGLRNATNLIPVLEAGVAGERNEGEWEFGPNLSLPIPLFDQGQARFAVARSGLQRSRQMYFAEAVEIRAAVRAVHQSLVSTAARVRHSEEVLLPLRTRIVNETQLQYNAGQLGGFELLLAKQQQINTALQYITTLHDYWRARTQLAQILSGGLADRVFADNPALEVVSSAESNEGLSESRESGDN